LSVAALVTAALVTCAMGDEASRLDCFSHADGATYFSLSLKPEVDVAPAGANDIVVLFDTSASQTGEHREKALAALKSLLGNLTADDRVHLMASDLNAVPMNESFVAPDSPAMAEAIAKLEARVPLGATDMQESLAGAASSLADSAANPKAIIYIGDGVSKANLLGTEKFQRMVAPLVDGRIAVSSYPVGPQLELRLLGAIAANTGGRMIGGPVDVEPEAAGSQLASAARATVFWPEQEEVDLAGELQVFPTRTPPLRSDRDTILIGKYEGRHEGPIEVSLTAQTHDGEKSLKWTVMPTEPAKSNDFLVKLVDTAAKDGGLGLPLVDSAALASLRNEIITGGYNLGQLALQALNSNDLDKAQKLAQGALKQEPESAEAKSILRVVARRRAGDETAPAEDTLNMTGPAEDDSAADAAAPFSSDGAFIDAVDRTRKIIQEQVSAEVVNTVNQARGSMSQNPQAAIQSIKQQMENVRRVTDLEPDVRSQLLDQLQAALRTAQNRSEIVEQQRQEHLEGLASAKERELLNEGLQRKQQKIRQLMERFNSLMEEKRFTLAEDAAAAQAMELDNRNPVPIAATITAAQTGALYEGIVLRKLRHRRILDTLYSVEKAYVPFNDDEPILYPDAEVWRDLTERRVREYRAMDLASRGDAEKRIFEALDQPTTLDFVEEPLQGVVDFWKEEHGINIKIDTRALEDLNLGTDEPITETFDGISLRSAMRMILRPLELNFMVEDEVLKITTQDVVDTNLTTKVYPVGDLVIPIISMGGMGGMGGGMMGGMGGGMMGGMGGGMGGGMMGGMGGGMGGMGGRGGGMMGGMGGGMFNVPPNLIPNNLLPNPGAGGFKAFSVPDELSLTGSGEKAEVAAKPEEKFRKIEIEVADDADPETVWNEHFANHQESPEAVRDAVRRLMSAKKFDHVIALTNAALRHGEKQTWMYEVMTLAMQAAERPKAEIERAVTSALDFCDTPLDMMYIASYMERIGLEQRSLSIYQQVAELVPWRPEPYVHGLRVARAIDDLEGIKWATAGIISRAWTGDRAEVWDTGIRVAKTKLEELRAQKRFDEADQFEAVLDEAMVRDCLIRVSWTGTADVDMIVEEPSGSICSHRNPRTTAGGTMTEDSFSKSDEESSGSLSEMYVCPKAFAGTYRVLLRRVWGHLTAGKVTVEFYANHGTEQEKVLRKTIELGDKDALVIFALNEGRRTEPVEEQQIANAAADQLRMHEHIVAQRHHVLAQQLASGVDTGSMAGLMRSRQNMGGLSPLFVRGGSVGYQPVIEVLPEGTMMSTMAVISADRRRRQ